MSDSRNDSTFKLGKQGKTRQRNESRKKKEQAKEVKKNENQNSQKSVKQYRYGDKLDLDAMFKFVDPSSLGFNNQYSTSPWGSSFFGKQINPRLNLIRKESGENLSVRSSLLKEVTSIFNEWSTLVFPSISLSAQNRAVISSIDSLIQAEKVSIEKERKNGKDYSKDVSPTKEANLKKEFNQIDSNITDLKADKDRSDEDKLAELKSFIPFMNQFKQSIAKQDIDEIELTKLNNALTSYVDFIRDIWVIDYPQINEIVEAYQPIVKEATIKLATPLSKAIAPEGSGFDSALLSPIAMGGLGGIDESDFLGKFESLATSFRDRRLSIESDVSSQYGSVSGSLIQEDSDGSSVVESIDAKSQKKIKLGELQISAKADLDKLINEAILGKVPTLTILSGLKQIFPLFNFSPEEEREYLTKIINKTTQSSLIKVNADLKQELADNAEEMKELFESKSTVAVTLEPEFARTIKIDSHLFDSESESESESEEEEFVQPKYRRVKSLLRPAEISHIGMNYLQKNVINSLKNKPVYSSTLPSLSNDLRLNQKPLNRLSTIEAQQVMNSKTNGRIFPVQYYS